MKGPPPYIVRRFVLAPLAILLALVLLGTFPIWLIAAAFASRYVPGRWRPLRVGWFFFLYTELQAIMIVVYFAQWIASGFGARLKTPRFQDLTYRTAAWWLRRVMGSARRTFSLQIDFHGDDLAGERPLLLLTRHAGPGDSFLLVDDVLNFLDRRPRIVLKDMLRVDPCIDIPLSRVPTRFVPSRGRAGAAVVEAIRDLAGTMGRRDAFVIFPEGGNFTVKRRERAIAKLDEIGRPDLADRARAMIHVLPPKPQGVLTAIAAAPDADVAFIGHVGLERLSTLRALWRGIPMDSAIEATAWRVPAEQVPPPEEREAWLYDHWQQIDDWVDARLTASADPAEPTEPAATES
ncbi:hypothetical protein P0L94_11935 [Microbacter sp. GSS18]|nr:hypothetical protein P0L94_11935 [Microbacter sp. GSS18]